MTFIPCVLGPTFTYERTEAGLGSLNLPQNSAGIFYDELVITADQLTQLKALIESHDPSATYIEANLYDTKLGWKMGTDNDSIIMYYGDGATIQSNLFGLSTEQESTYMASSFTIIDNTDAPHIMTVAEALPIYTAYWNFRQTLN